MTDPNASSTTDPIHDLGPGCDQSRDVAPPRSSMILLVDQSQTMVTETVDHDGDLGTPEVTRWRMLREGLEARMSDLVELVDVGLQPFPSRDVPPPPDADACVTASDGVPPPASADELLAAIPDGAADALAGATPTQAGIAHAQDLFPRDPAVERRIVLLTDGAPNCSANAMTLDDLFDLADSSAAASVATLHGEGVAFHVIGIDVPEGNVGGGPEGDAITDHRARLQELAEAGGTELVFTRDASSLDIALVETTLSARSCRLRIPPELLEYPTIEVALTYEGIEIVPELDPETCAAGERGYRYLDTDVIEFCGSACPAFTAQGSARVTGGCFVGPE